MTTGADFTIGRDVGVFGRWFRLIVGVYFTLLLTAVPIFFDPISAGETLAFLGETGLYFVLILAVYLLGTYLLGERVLARVNPWVGTLIFLGPLAVITALEIGPRSLGTALGLYYSISSIFNFAMSYGGCEVIAIPSLVFGRRYTVYCPYNAVDSVEVAMRAKAPGQRVFGSLAAIIALLVGSYFILFKFMELDEITGVASDPRMALLLLIPVAFLLRSAWLVNKGRPERANNTGSRLLIGALVLSLLAVMWFFELGWGPIWAGVMLLGGLYALVKFIRSGLSRPATGFH